MPAGTVFLLPTQALLDISAPKKTSGLPDVQTNQRTAPTQSCHGLQPSFPPPGPDTTTPSIQPGSTSEHGSDANLAVPQPQNGEAEDEYTLSAYGDISLGEIIVPLLPTHADASALPSKAPQPRLRLKMQRPPMPRRRMSCYIPDPMPHSCGLDFDEQWPGSPRPTVDKLPWIQHQPLASPLSVDPASALAREDDRVKKSVSDIENLFDEPLPSQALGRPRETHEQKSTSVYQRQPQKTDGAPGLPKSPPAPTPRQDQPKPTPWRTRLPPRLPIPKWDI